MMMIVIGTAGFEPTTPTTPKWCATKLRYAPFYYYKDKIDLNVILYRIVIRSQYTFINFPIKVFPNIIF